MSDEEDQALGLIRKHLLNSRGFDISGYSRSFTERCVRKRVGRTGARSLLDYVGHLRRDENELSELIAALSINVTGFFRDEGAFETLSKLVIGPLVQRKVEQGWSALRIWSAGCASGQETYTIAVCVSEELKRVKGASDIAVRIKGTDLSKKALELAREGDYGREQVKGLPRRYLDEYFIENGIGYTVGPALRRLVKFTEGNLLEKPLQKHFDLIVCRNVVIYFSRPTHDLVIGNLHAALRPQGYLMLGRTETLMGAPRTLFDILDHENRIFQKRGALPPDLNTGVGNQGSV